MTTALQTDPECDGVAAVGTLLDRRVMPQPVVRAAYADPPYLGCGKSHYGHLHDEAADYDDPETHRRRIQRLCDEFDCWALSLHEPSLRVLLPMCPPDVRVAPWIKPFASWKGKGLPHAWEPVILMNKTGRKHRTRDWVSAMPPAFSGGAEPMLGVPGQKPRAFSHWLFDALTLETHDEFCDVFPGSGAVGDAWQRWKNREAPEQLELLGHNVRAEPPP